MDSRIKKMCQRNFKNKIFTVKTERGNLKGKFSLPFTKSKIIKKQIRNICETNKNNVCEILNRNNFIY